VISVAEAENKVILTDEEGEEHEFTLLGVIEVEGKEYVILAAGEAAEEDVEEAIILRLEKDADGDDTLVEIDDDEELESVVAAWEELVEEELDWDEELQ
jgi:putative Holliday junction resolvase